MTNNNTQQQLSPRKEGESITQEVDYTIQDLFFYQEIDNGNLLATSTGKLGQQSERAAIFVPSSGNETGSDFLIKSSEDDSITLMETSSGIQLSYYLFNIKNSKNALIIKREADTRWELIFYDRKSNEFQKASVDNFFKGTGTDKIKQSKNIAISGSNLILVDIGLKFNWNENSFNEN